VADDVAQLLEFAERPRVQDWSLRAALTRYSQPEPKRVGDLLEVVRRIELAVKPHVRKLLRDGGTEDPFVESLLAAMGEVDRLGDVLATWAADPWNRDRPDAEVDAVTADVNRRLAELGVPREQRPPTRARGRGT
jgi:hypothetical protein